jgi:4-hydroxybenzoate polyprenyltransferase
VSTDVGLEVGERRRGWDVAAVVAALRIRQWTKNLLVFAGIVFAAKLDDPVRWLEAIACFVA